MADLDWIKLHVKQQQFRLTLHAQVELANDEYGVDDFVHAVANAIMLEDYPDAQRGACCLISGVAKDGRAMHIVVTTGGELPIVITVYEPLPPKWLTPTKRGTQQ